ncbi:thioesterase II family protein [Symbiopectobacterium sp. RP]|uniref:thioesterase II family protein n=1 Tax=Symbiopectobacterium sp. RP TaxID=3248553 RepID=UPI003D2A3F5F
MAVAAVQYPGREDRFTEATIDDMSRLLATLMTEFQCDIATRPYSLLGHSMDGAIAHELAVQLEAQGMPPRHLFISGRQPPRYHPRDSVVHRSSDSDILAELRRLNPRNNALVESPELAALLVPIIRSDYRLIENYRPHNTPVIGCPIDVLAGRDDPDFPADQACACAWADYTSASCQVHIFPGDHFFINQQRDAVVDTVQQAFLSSLTPCTKR